MKNDVKPHLYKSAILADHLMPKAFEKWKGVLFVVESEIIYYIKVWEVVELLDMLLGNPYWTFISYHEITQN